MNTTSATGAKFMRGEIIFPNGKRYTWVATVVSKTSIQEQMDYLKEYSESKIEDAKKAIKDDVSDILEIKTLKNAVTQWLSGKAGSRMKKVFPKQYSQMSKLSKICKKYDKVKSAVTGLKPPDLTGKLAPDVIKDIAGYNTKVQSYYDLVDQLEDLFK